MPPKRAYANSKRKLGKKYKKPVKALSVSASVLQGAIRRTLFKNAETKQSQTSSSDYRQIEHNSFITLDNNILYTEQGVTDPTTNSNYGRIGDEITLLKAKFCMMIELNERYSDCTYRIMLIKSARGDVPTLATLFTGLSGNKMLDTLNFERYTLLYQKWGKIKAPNISAGAEPFQPITAGGIYTQNTNNYLSRATKIIKFDIAGTKFAKDGKIIYDSGGTQNKFFDYTLLMYAYTNYNTLAPTGLTAGYNVLAVNDYYHLLKYKDM